jgi:hypothetical protein
MNLLKNKNAHINEINEVLDLKENFTENFIEKLPISSTEIIWLLSSKK